MNQFFSIDQIKKQAVFSNKNCRPFFKSIISWIKVYKIQSIKKSIPLLLPLNIDIFSNPAHF
jgi:hypothetical protein